MSHLATVQSIYAAFGRGDVPAILNLLADDVDWEYGAPSTPVPWLQPRRGRAAVGGFFEALRALEFHTFQVTELFERGNLVVAMVDLEATVRTTGRRFTEVDEAHVWRFDAAGRVARFRHRVDTHLQYAAWHEAENDAPAHTHDPLLRRP